MSIHRIRVIRVLSVALLAIALFLCVSPDARQAFAQAAQDESEVTEAGTTSQARRLSRAAADRGEWVIAGYLGGAHTAPSPLRISQPTLGNDITLDHVRFDGESFEPPLYYGFRGASFIRGLSSLGVEAEFVHLKVFSESMVSRNSSMRGGVRLGNWREERRSTCGVVCTRSGNTNSLGPSREAKYSLARQNRVYTHIMVSLA